MADVIGHGMSKLLQISVGILLAAITSLAYWETRNNSSESTAGAASLSPIKVMEGLRMEINENLHKFHYEMGYAEWIVYFTYGAIGFLAAVVAVILLLLLLKAQVRRNLVRDASCQTDSSITSCSGILHEQDLMDSSSLHENETQSVSTRASTACSTEDSGINFFDDCDVKVHHQENEGSWACPSSSPPTMTTVARLDISFRKIQNAQHPGDSVTYSSYMITTLVLELDAVAILERYSTRYFMPAPVVSAPQGQLDGPSPTSPTLFNGQEIPNIEISVEEDTHGIVDDIQY